MGAPGTYPAIAHAARFLRGMRARPHEVLIETSAACDGWIENELQVRGWSIGYELPVHLIPVCSPEWRGLLRPLPVGYSIREVTDSATLDDYAFVQDAAHRDMYDQPRGAAALFYVSPSSLCGPDVVAAVLYDVDARPVRTAALQRAGGLVSGVGGAAVPSVRGQHLGEPLMRHLGEAAASRFGVDSVVHITMPVARPIAVRLGLPVIDTYRRWVPAENLW